MAPELKPVYLITGSDRPKVEQAVRRLRARVGEDAAEILSASEASGADVVAACNASGLFASEGRAVIVHGVNRWKSADTAAVAAYLSDPAPGTVLALVADEIKRDSPLAKACAKAGDLLLFDVERKKLPAWVAQRFTDLGAQADREACRLLLELVGEELVELDSEIRKLATWANGDTVDATAVEQLAAGRAEIAGYALTDAWGARDPGAALTACEAILDRSSSSRAGAIARVVGSLTQHVRRVAEVQALDRAGMPTQKIASQLKRAPYYVGKLVAQARNFDEDELGEVVVGLAELDVAVKGGSRLPADLELERALAVAAAPRTAA